jgi:hypothetical protein
MTVSAADFQGLVNWCQQQPAIPLIHHVVLADLACYNGDIMEDYYKGTLSYAPPTARNRRLFPANFYGTLSTIYPGQESVHVGIALDPDVYIGMAFTGGRLNGTSFETNDFGDAPEGNGLFISFFLKPNTYYLTLATGSILSIPHTGVKVPIAKKAAAR